MDATQAIEIIQALADGVDPYIGEVLSDGSPYQHPQTVRALFLAVKALGRYEGSVTCRGTPVRHGRRRKMLCCANGSLRA